MVTDCGTWSGERRAKKATSENSLLLILWSSGAPAPPAYQGQQLLSRPGGRVRAGRARVQLGALGDSEPDAQDVVPSLVRWFARRRHGA